MLNSLLSVIGATDCLALWLIFIFPSIFKLLAPNVAHAGICPDSHSLWIHPVESTLPSRSKPFETDQRHRGFRPLAAVQHDFAILRRGLSDRPFAVGAFSQTGERWQADYAAIRRPAEDSSNGDSASSSKGVGWFLEMRRRIRYSFTQPAFLSELLTQASTNLTPFRPSSTVG